MAEAEVDVPKSRKQRRFEEATREYRTTCIACGALLASGRVKGRSQAQLDRDNAPRIDAHQAKCLGVKKDEATK